MKIHVNGELKVFPDTGEPPRDLSLYQLLKDLDLDPDRAGIAVAMDQQVIRRQLWLQTVVQSGCQIEIIQAVQGG